MDKRTLIFVLSLSLTLFLVNNFFHYRDIDDKRAWYEQQMAKKVKERAQLAAAMEERTARAEDLPLVKLYADAKETDVLSTGARIKDSVIVLAWSEDLPPTVYSNGTKFTLAYSPEQVNGPALYEVRTEDALPIGSLSYFGNYDLQLVQADRAAPGAVPRIFLGQYLDGQFHIPLLQWNALNKEIEDGKEPLRAPGNSLVLMQTAEGYLPIAVFDPASQGFTFLEQVEGLRTEIIKPQLTISGEKEEQFYVLENDYQQLVFSSKGGALVEINLPFETKKNRDSVVKEIEFDRQIVENHPYNAEFPLKSYFTHGETPNGPFIEHSKGKLGGYYPLIRRDLINRGKQKSIRMLPQYYAFNIVSDYPEMSELHYEVTHFGADKIVFEAQQQNRKIVKTYTLPKDENSAPYVFDLSIRVEGDSRGLWITSGIPEVEWISNGPAPALKYRITRKGKAEVNSMKMPSSEPEVDTSLYPDWLCNSNGFFGLIIDPLTEINPGFRAEYVSGTVAPSRLVLIDEAHERFKAKDLPGYMELLPLNQKGGTMQFRVFAGPFATKTLKTVDNKFADEATGYNPDYISSQSTHGIFSFISAPFSKFLFILMNFFHSLTHSWVLSIVLLTVALRLMLYPLNAWSTKSMLKMQQISPKVQEIQEKYKKDPRKVQTELMNLYRESGVNPVSGCFPLLIQMPFLIGMFDLLKSTFELRGAVFIPGWIDNLAAPDVLFSWSTPIFFIGNEFHLLPFLLGGVMYVQQKAMSTLPKDPSQLTEQQRQQKMMGNMMTVVFAVMFYHFPSGLNIYWLSSMLLGILQQWWMQKRFKATETAVALQPAPARKEKPQRSKK